MCVVHKNGCRTCLEASSGPLALPRCTMRRNAGLPDHCNPLLDQITAIPCWTLLTCPYAPLVMLLEMGALRLHQNERCALMPAPAPRFAASIGWCTTRRACSPSYMHTTDALLLVARAWARPSMWLLRARLAYARR